MSIDPELICPRCNLPLKEVRISGRIFWGCDNCAGRAVTVELLRRTFTPASINPLWLHAIRGEGSSGRLCPSCRKPMIEVALSDQTQVDVDVCRHCHFVWFDAHEIDALVPQPVPATATELSPEAREQIAIAKCQQLAEEARGSDWDSAPPDAPWKQIAAFFGLPVEFDEPAQERIPWATWLLALAMVMISAAAFANLREIVHRFGLIPAEATRLHGFTFVSSFFLHTGIIHLAGNMYFLLVFGDNVENSLKPFRYLVVIALAALLGDLAHIALDPQSRIPSIGASGGIAGVITFYALQFPRVRLGFLTRWGIVWFRWIRMPAWFALVLWIVFQLIGTWEQKAGISSVSAVAHLGGAAMGFLGWLVWRKEPTNVES